MIFNRRYLDETAGATNVESTEINCLLVHAKIKLIVMI